MTFEGEERILVYCDVLTGLKNWARKVFQATQSHM